MQTLRKKNSPCKYKNEPSRFLGEGITFKAKLIGILEVNEARGDKMCQDALNDLKTAIRAAGEHKQRITISIAIDGLRLRDEKTGDYMYHHPVHKISFIAQDMSDSRAFGYIFGSPDTGHRFFGIKTDKTASQVVITMRDLFQVVFELKKKEIEMAKHHIEQHQIKYGSSSYGDSTHSTKEELEGEKPKGKYPPPLKTSCITSNVSEASTSAPKANTEAIADLLDLEHELNSIQQGINQMERITPSDPFGPISKGDPFLDPFDDSFQSKTEKTQEAKVPPPSGSKPGSTKNRTPSQSSSKEASDVEKPSSLFSSAASTSSKTHFFSQFSPGVSKAKTEDNHWFDQETESLFNETANVNNTEPTSSPVTFHTPTAETEQAQDDRKSPTKADVFTELDPLGTGRVKPYVDKKDFFQELKNPPKKVLKELLTETSAIESTHYFPAHFESNKSPQNSNLNPNKEPSVIKNTLVNASSNILNSFPSKDSSTTSKYSRIDPFDDTDPFEKTDPFLEESFPQSIGFPPLFSSKSSFDGVFPEKITSKYEKVSSRSRREEIPPKTSPPKSSLFSAGMSSLHGPLRVSLPPEKLDTSTPISISTITSKFRSSPSPPEETKTHRRKYYQTLKQSNDERSDDCCQSPTHEELFNRRSPKFGSHFPSRSHTERKSPYKEKSYSVQSPLPVRHEKGISKMSSSVEFLDATPDPPPRPKAALFSIKPPPLPPKKQNQPNFRPPPRPPSIEDSTIQYDYIKNQEEAVRNRFEFKEEPKSPRLKREISTGKDPPSRQNSDANMSSSFPILPPPPHRKSPADPNKSNADAKSQNENKISSPKSSTKTESNESILNLTLNQLDHSGLENLAITLGIPSDSIYNMTLQELTKRLAQKYLGSDEPNKTCESSESEKNEMFQADFDANFSKTDSKKDSAPPYDKYAVFKELIEKESKKADTSDNESKQENENDRNVEQPDAETTANEIMKKEEEDRYAALRQLSLCAQKSENLSEELDVSNEDDSSARADNISDILRHHTEDSFTPINNLEMTNDSPVTKSAIDWPNQSSGEREEKKEKEDDLDQLCSEKSDILPETDWGKPQESKDSETSGFPPEKDLFSSNRPLNVDRKEDDTKENWATFEKAPSFEEIATTKIAGESFNENENSPFSSDGKEDVKEVPFNWHQKVSKRRGRGNDVPWQDEDESWDDYSPKESYWSDESSHEDRSPDKRSEDRYQRRSWNKHSRMAKAPPLRSDKSDQWNRREKWHDDTEDEYEESYRKHRCRVSSFDEERKKDSWQGNDYDGYEKPLEWFNNRKEPWDENERYARGYGERRKRSESDDEYRRRCDSDASDREYVWTFKRGYPDNFGRTEKQKQYYMPPYSSRDWQDRCHESRSKHKKGGSHKRPSSASETKRNYEKMYSPVDHMPRSMDKVLPVKRQSEEEEFSPRFHPSQKDSRYHFVFDSGHHYNSYDRRSQAMHSKRVSRGSRNDSVGSTQNEVFSPPTKTEEKTDPKDKNFHYFPSDSIRDQNLKNKKPEEPARSDIARGRLYQFEDDFTPGSFEKQSKLNQSPKRDISRSPRRKKFDKDEWTTNNKSNEDSFFQQDNNNDNFANFNDEPKMSPKKCMEMKMKGDTSSVILPKPHGKSKNHFSMLNRQDSSASLRKSESINIFSRENDPFEDDDFFSSVASNNAKLNRFTSEKSKSNSNVSDPFTWKEVFGDSNFQE